MEVINERQKNFAINFIMYVITFCFLFLIGITRTFAYSYTTIGDQANITVVLVSTNYSNQPFNVPINSGYNFNQVLQVDYLIDNYSFIANRHYQLETHLTNQTFTNANQYFVTGLNGEQCLLDYSASIFTGSYPRWDFQCPSATTSITLTIKNNANQYLWDNGVYTWTSALLSYSTEPITSGSTNQDIINNNNQNTQNIINNNNQNTQNIINNNNQNTQDIINSNRVCETVDKNSIEEDNKVIYDTGVNTNNNFGITKYFKIDTDTEIKVLQSRTGYAMYCFYDINKIQLSCGYNNTLVSGNTLTIPNNSSYFRASINKSENKPTFEVCKNGNQALNDSINNLDDTINDDNISDAENEASEFFNSFSTETFGLTGIITAPLNLIQSILSTSCSPLHIPLPFLEDNYLDIPCIKGIFNRHFQPVLILYQTITYGIIAYWVCVRIFNLVKDFKNPEHDEIEVLDL